MDPDKPSSEQQQQHEEKVQTSLDAAEKGQEKQHSEDTGVDPDAPLGIQKVYLIKKYARRVDIWIIIVGIIMVAWAKNWEGNTTYSVLPLVTSYLNAANQVALLSTVQYILQTVLIPFFAKLADMWGRSEVFVLCLLIYIISGVVFATSNTISDLCGAQVLYAIGVSGAHCVGHILIADITSTVNRGLFQAFYDVPALINIFVAPIAGQVFSQESNWRWVYSMIPFCIGGTSLILFFGLFRAEISIRRGGHLQAVKAELTEHRGHLNKSFSETFMYFANEVDVVGSLLMIGTLCMLLLPLVLATTDFGGWNSPTTIGLLVGGALCLLVLIYYEKKVAPKPMIPFGNWDDITPVAGVLSVSMISAITGIGWNYFLLYLQVSRRWDVIKSTHVDRSYDAVYLVAQVAAGFLLKKFKVYRPVVLTGICLFMLGEGLMIPSRFPDSSAVMLVASQVIAGWGAGWVFVPTLVAVQSAVPTGDLAIATALYQVGTTLAYSVGSAISGSVWNNRLPAELAANIPGEFDLNQAFSNIVYVLELPEEQYLGAVTAYGNVIRILCIISLCLSVLALVFACFLRPFSLQEDESTKASKEEKPSWGRRIFNTKLVAF